MSVSLKRTAIAASLLLAVTLTAGLVVTDAQAATSLRDRLDNAQRELKKANQRLDAAQEALDAALAAEPGATETTITPLPAPVPVALTSGSAAGESEEVEDLKAKVATARKQVSVWKKKVRELAALVKQEEQIDAWERERDWMSIIKIAAAKYDVKADGMYRMMMRESGGDPRAGASGQFRGLFQYWTGTWKNSWNPWRNESIFDGSSQIFATAYAIHKGMGPMMWTTTFASQY